MPRTGAGPRRQPGSRPGAGARVRSSVGLGSAAGQQADLAALDLGGSAPTTFGSWVVEGDEDLPLDLLDWDDTYPDDDADDSPHSEPERPLVRFARPIIVFESVGGHVEYEIPRSDRVLASRAEAARHRERLAKLADFLAVNHQVALTAPTLAEAFAGLPGSTSQLAAQAVGYKDGTALSRWYSDLVVSAPVAMLPVSFLFARAGQSHRVGESAPVLANAIRCVRTDTGKGANEPLLKPDVTRVLDIATDELLGSLNPGQTPRNLRESLRKLWPKVDKLITHPAEMTAYQRTWPYADPKALLQAVGAISPSAGSSSAHEAGVTFGWAALCGVLNESESAP